MKIREDDSDMTNNESAYELEKRELIAEAPGLRVQVLTLGPGQCVPWHRHTEISDTFFCLEGEVVLQTRDPETTLELRAGQRATVPAKQPHRVSGANDTRCSFLIVQGVGEYDYLPEPG